jgi:mannosyltransferase
MPAAPTSPSRWTTSPGPSLSIYFVRADGYRTLETTCGSISDQLAALRDRTFQVSRRQVVEGATLERFSTR